MKGGRSGASLRLTELIFAVLIFSLCAAVVLQLFSASNNASEKAYNLDRAVFAAESAIEEARAEDPDSDTIFWINYIYDKDWDLIKIAETPIYSSTYTPAPENARFFVSRLVTVDIDSGITYALITVRDVKVEIDDSQDPADVGVIYEIETSWYTESEVAA